MVVVVVVVVDVEEEVVVRGEVTVLVVELDIRVLVDKLTVVVDGREVLGV